MAFVLNSAGPTTIFNSTAITAGEWYRIHPRLSNLGIQVIHTGSSVGATVSSTTLIQVSNDGVQPLETTAGSTVDAAGVVALTGGSPQSAGFGLAVNWGWIRAKPNSAPSTGTVRVIVTGQMRS
jgi:hypothetical protein